MTIKTRTLPLILLSLFLAIYFMGWHIGHEKAESVAKTTVEGLNEIISGYVLEVNDARLYITEKEKEILSLEGMVKQVSMEKDNYRKLYLKALDDITYKQAQIDILIDSINHISIVQPCDSL